MWRVVASGYATLAEVERDWDICDVAEANEWLDAEGEAREALAQKEGRA
ncbi:hypothetical protein [Corallococcus sp. EGB]|nr:hypothetical protein [Corallococcus sp. EGB]